MAFTRVNAGGWAYGTKLTSAQQNQLDVDHANALDKSTAGDSIAGTIAFTGAGTIDANQAGAITATAGSGIESTVFGGIQPTVPGGILTDVSGGIVSYIAGGILPVVAGGIQSNVSGGIQSTANGGIISTVASGIKAGIEGGIVGDTFGGIQPITTGGILCAIPSGIEVSEAGGLVTTAAGGFQLGGGTNDYPTFSAARTISRGMNLAPIAVVSPWTNSGIGIVGNGTNAPQYMAISSERLIQGATLVSVEFFFYVGTSHSSVPASLPTFSIQRGFILGGVSYTGNFATLASSDTGSGLAFPTPGSGSAWYDSANTQSFTYTCNQNNTIDTTAYNYFIQLDDEHGSGAASGNTYFAVILNMSTSTLAYP
jgi:hypothetical protein